MFDSAEEKCRLNRDLDEARKLPSVIANAERIIHAYKTGEPFELTETIPLNVVAVWVIVTSKREPDLSKYIHVHMSHIVVDHFQNNLKQYSDDFKDPKSAKSPSI